MDMKTSPISLLKDPSLLKTDAFINGQWLAGSARFDVHDPSSGLKLADVDEGIGFQQAGVFEQGDGGGLHVHGRCFLRI